MRAERILPGRRPPRPQRAPPLGCPVPGAHSTDQALTWKSGHLSLATGRTNLEYPRNPKQEVGVRMAAIRTMRPPSHCSPSFGRRHCGRGGVLPRPPRSATRTPGVGATTCATASTPMSHTAFGSRPRSRSTLAAATWGPSSPRRPRTAPGGGLGALSQPRLRPPGSALRGSGRGHQGRPPRVPTATRLRAHSTTGAHARDTRRAGRRGPALGVHERHGRAPMERPMAQPEGQRKGGSMHTTAARTGIRGRVARPPWPSWWPSRPSASWE